MIKIKITPNKKNTTVKTMPYVKSSSQRTSEPTTGIAPHQAPPFFPVQFVAAPPRRNHGLIPTSWAGALLGDVAALRGVHK
ncbi:hypothetical protein JTE90_026233 [Oedothorax gibbosus]|uniref:Uncharacterized protein n=1 Tax=Oedothorax gibbosus TaxID=931172 RepID=A0AAV6U9S5_9ARAC|nr:hypothetical protein JTE90_026233 [Oedothorax gibbosus]